MKLFVNNSGLNLSIPNPKSLNNLHIPQGTLIASPFALSKDLTVLTKKDKGQALAFLKERPPLITEPEDAENYVKEILRKKHNVLNTRSYLGNREYAITLEFSEKEDVDKFISHFELHDYNFHYLSVDVENNYVDISPFAALVALVYLD